MADYFDAFKIKCSPVSNEKNTVICKDTRITVLTACLLRIEVSASGIFCDEPTQAVWFRDFDLPEYTLKKEKNKIIIKTSLVEFCYDVSSHKMKYVKLSDGRYITEYKSGNLKGTCRTLDRSFGAVKLENGIISKNGVAVLDDSSSLILNSQAEIMPRSNREKDEYYFAYGNDYKGALYDFFRLTGFSPLVPKFALGNWWSRYKAYTQKEYTDLMQEFIDREIPVTVATVDMDWHWVNVETKFGKEAAKNNTTLNFMEKIYDLFISSGWTGYSWNTDLFPNPEEFLTWLKDRNFKVTLNMHPASGIRCYEDCYGDFAKFMGDNPEDKKQYSFDITDKKFLQAYFSIAHKPHEDMGVDFWWIDWQQGNKTKIKGLDPLWALNHYHSMDIARDGKRRPLILSRFAGAGSHRYPLGFSGDTAQNWKVLDFQPYFTSTASNIGYTWWSHDIGGHHFGRKDDELYLRWVQFGVFSPIMRLHSTSNEFMGKEPWKYSKSVENTAIDFMRLRHRLLPYLYTMNYRTSVSGRAICEPMYYEYPDCENAYKCKNEYFFGSELISAPITTPKSKKTNLAHTTLWLPEGRYTDIFTDRIYNGNKILEVYRDESSIPVLAKQGAIIPLDMNCRTNLCSNPADMEILIYRGNNKFSMYEDDGETMNYQNGCFAFTDFEVNEDGDNVSFSVSAVRGDSSAVPQLRNYTLSFKDVVCAQVGVEINGEPVNAAVCDKDGFVSVELKDTKPTDNVCVCLKKVKVLENPTRREALIELISKFQMNNNSKLKKFSKCLNEKADLRVKKCFRGPIEEIESLY